jgi:ABC-type amino acid transport substrate-binding protein
MTAGRAETMTAGRLALAALLAGWAVAARAETPEYVIGVESHDYLPIYGVLANGGYGGAGRQILDRFAAAQGVRFVYRALPVNRLYAELASGNLDFKFPDSPHWNPAAKAGLTVSYSQPVIRYVDGTLVPPQNRGRPVTQLGTIRGFTPFAWQGRIEAGAVQVHEAAGLDLLLTQTIKSRVDGAYASVAVAYHHLNTVLAQPGALVFDPSQPHTRDAYLLSTAKHPALIAAFNAWLAANAAAVHAIVAETGAEAGID